MVHTLTPRSSSRSRRVTLGAVAALAALTVSATTALADGRFRTKTSDTSAEAYWTSQAGSVSSQFGNTHTGSLVALKTARGAADVQGAVSDYACDPGEVVIGFPPTPVCDELPTRYFRGSDLAFTFDAQINESTVRGTVDVFYRTYDPEVGGDVETPVGTMNVNIAWTAWGERFDGHTISQLHQRSNLYIQAQHFVSRNAIPNGAVGEMAIDASNGFGYLSRSSDAIFSFGPPPFDGS